MLLDISDILSILIGCLVQGSVFSLIALGFSLIYGVGGILNLGHGAFFVLTGYLLMTFLAHMFYPLALIFSLITIVIIGAIIFILLIKPIQETEISVVIVTFGLAFLIEEFISTSEFGTQIIANIPYMIEGGIEIHPEVSILLFQQILLIIASIIIVIIFIIFISKSKLGRSIRAVSQDREAALLMGINADRILMYTFMIAALLAGIAALFYLPTSSLYPSRVWTILTTAFAVVIFGGLGNLKGSIASAYVITFISNVTHKIDPAFTSVIPIILIFIILIIRPRGLFGKKEI